MMKLKACRLLSIRIGLVLAGTFAASEILACTVCFGESEGEGLSGLWLSAGLLVGLVYGLLAAMGVLMWRAQRRKSRLGKIRVSSGLEDTGESAFGDLV